MKPTYEELEARCHKLENLLKKALERILLIEERLNQNSNNSSKPPSTDRKAKGKRGKKKERPSRAGAARALIPLEQVDKHEVCKLKQCPRCGAKSLKKQGAAIFQQVELPEVKGIVTQYDQTKYHCGACAANCLAPLPKGVVPSPFGPRVMALLSHLTGVTCSP